MHSGIQVETVLDIFLQKRNVHVVHQITGKFLVLQGNTTAKMASNNS